MSHQIAAVALFARAPVPARAKTRLIPLLGTQGAADFQYALIADAARKLSVTRSVARPYIFLAGRGRASLPILNNSRIALRSQRGASLGTRLERAFRFLLRHHPTAVIFGTDSPLIPPRMLRVAIDNLRTSDAVLGPCPDGGYYLIGLQRSGLARSTCMSGSSRSSLQLPGSGARGHSGNGSRLLSLPAIFNSVRWSTRFAFRDTLRNLLRLGLSCRLLRRVADVDRPEDFRVLYKRMAASAVARRTASNTWRFVEMLGPDLHSRLSDHRRR